MRWLLILLLVPVQASAQTTTSCRWYGSEQVCTSSAPPPIQGSVTPDYSRLLGLDTQPTYQQQEAQRLQNKRLQLENEALERRQTDNRGTSPERCKNGAMAALARDDLRSARDVLNLCVGR